MNVLLARLENCHATCAVSFPCGGGSGGNGVPSASKVARFPCGGGNGGKGVPSACSVWGVPVAVGWNLVELDEGTNNETAIKLKPTANAIFVQRMDGAS